MEEMTETNSLGSEKIGRLIFRYAIPSIISFVVNSLYNMVDQVFIGQGVGYLGNAATNVILPITMILLALGLMIGDGAAAFMSLNLGKGNQKAAAHSVGNMITLTIGAGIIMLAVFEVFLLPACRLFGATESTMPYALDYGRIIVAGAPFAMVSAAFGSVIRADGRPKLSMVGLVIGCITNIILDPIFIFGFKWGVKGAAFATIIGQALNAIFFIICLVRCNTVKLEKDHLLPDVSVDKKIISLGTSSFVTQIATVFVMAVNNNLLVNYGAASVYGPDIPLATFGITMKVSQIILGITLGIATSVQPIYGYNYGSGKYGRVKKTYKIAMLSSCLIMAFALFVFQVFPEPIINLFGQESDLYMEFAVKSFRIYLLACILIPATTVTAILFQAIGRPTLAAFLSMSRQVIILIPAMLLFGYLFGVEGLLWAGAFADFVSGIIALLIVRGCWKKIFTHKDFDER